MSSKQPSLPWCPIPTLRKYINDPGFFIVALIHRRAVTFQLNALGLLHLTDTLGLENKDQFSTEILIHLLRKGWAATAGASAEKVIAAIAGDTDKPSFDEARRLELTGSMKLQQRITFHLESGDPGMLDTALRDMVNAIAPGLCRLKGPFPLPTRVEQYTVLRDKTRVVHEVRTHKRVMMVDEPDKLFLSRTSQVMLQPGVGLKVRETKVAVGTFATFGELRADE